MLLQLRNASLNTSKFIAFEQQCQRTKYSCRGNILEEQGMSEGKNLEARQHISSGKVLLVGFWKQQWELSTSRKCSKQTKCVSSFNFCVIFCVKIDLWELFLKACESPQRALLRNVFCNLGFYSSMFLRKTSRSLFLERDHPFRRDMG